MSKGIVYKGKEYSNLGELADAFNINRNTLRGRVHGGMSVEEAVEFDPEFRENRVLEYKGKKYSNLREIADAFNINRNTLRGRIHSGMSIEEAIEMSLNKSHKVRGKTKLIYKGKEYKSLAELASEVGMKYHNLARRLSEGMSIEEAIEKPIKKVEKSIEYKGVKYKSKRELANAMGINYSTLLARLKEYDSVEEALERPVEKKERTDLLEYKGKQYRSVEELADKFGLDGGLIRARLRRGYSVEKAVEREVKQGKSKDVEHIDRETGEVKNQDYFKDDLKKKTEDTEENKAVQIGNNIKKRRKERKISQRQLAEKVGVSAQFISLVETGKAAPSLDTLQKIVVVLDADINELLELNTNILEDNSIKKANTEDWDSWEIKELREKLGELTMENQKLKLMLRDRDREIKGQKEIIVDIIGKVKKLGESIEKEAKV